MFVSPSFFDLFFALAGSLAENLSLEGLVFGHTRLYGCGDERFRRC